MIRLIGIRTARAACAAPAAPAGGAHRFWGRGCGYFVAVVSGFLNMLAASAASAGEAGVAPISVPSGQPVTLSEVLLDRDPGALWLRLRFVAPQISRNGGTATHDQAMADMDHLCQELALSYVQEHALQPERIVISFADRAVPFGVQDPAATQYFEAYRPSGDTCIWEGF